MKETDLQLRFIKQVIAMGGFAYKSSNSTLVGVCDIVMQFPFHPTWFVEAKFARPGPRTNAIHLDVTVPQARFLMKLHRVGAPCFVLSFVARGRNDNGVKLVPYSVFKELPGQMLPLAEFTFGKSWEREMESAIDAFRGALHKGQC